MQGRPARGKIWRVSPHLVPTSHRPSSTAGIVALLCALLLPLAIPAGASARGADVGSVTGVEASSPALWPTPEDGNQSITISITVAEVGDYRAVIEIGGGVAAEKDLGLLQPGTHTWVWDGRDLDGRVAREGRYYASAYRDDTSEWWADQPYAYFEVRHSADEWWTEERATPRWSRGTDIELLTVRTAKDGVSVTLDFYRGYRAVAGRRVVAQLDFDATRWGYTLSATATGGAWRRVATVERTTADHRVSAPRGCRTFEVVERRRAVTLHLPRRCVRFAGDSVRAFVVAQSGSLGDTAPSRGGYWTGWATYERPPEAS